MLLVSLTDKTVAMLERSLQDDMKRLDKLMTKWERAKGEDADKIMDSILHLDEKLDNYRSLLGITYD